MSEHGAQERLEFLQRHRGIVRVERRLVVVGTELCTEVVVRLADELIGLLGEENIILRPKAGGNSNGQYAPAGANYRRRNEPVYE